MTKRAAILASVVLLAGAAPPPGATNCSGCHSAGTLGGRSAGDLAATMLSYRSGERQSTIMGRLMKGLTPDQIQSVAGWVSAQNG